MIRPQARRAGITLAAVLAMAACSSQRDDPGTLSPQEKSQLSDAAAMLDANSIALEDAPANDIDGANAQ